MCGKLGMQLYKHRAQQNSQNKIQMSPKRYAFTNLPKLPFLSSNNTYIYLKVYKIITYALIPQLSRPKPVLQSLEHDWHVNIKFTSILTRTNPN